MDDLNKLKGCVNRASVLYAKLGIYNVPAGRDDISVGISLFSKECGLNERSTKFLKDEVKKGFDSYEKSDNQYRIAIGNSYMRGVRSDIVRTVFDKIKNM